MPSCAPAVTRAACAPCAGSPPACPVTAPFARGRHHPRSGRWPAGSSPARRPRGQRPRRAKADHPSAARISAPPVTWSATSRSCSATAAGSARKIGPPGRGLPGERTARPRQGTPQRLGRRHRWAHRPLQFRRRRIHVTRIKMLKRQMYGRANTDLLLPLARPARRLTPSRQLSQRHFPMTVDIRPDRRPRAEYRAMWALLADRRPRSRRPRQADLLLVERTAVQAPWFRLACRRVRRARPVRRGILAAGDNLRNGI
jgi:hypothetical protein